MDAPEHGGLSRNEKKHDSLAADSSASDHDMQNTPAMLSTHNPLPTSFDLRYESNIISHAHQVIDPHPPPSDPSTDDPCSRTRQTGDRPGNRTANFSMSMQSLLNPDPIETRGWLEHSSLPPLYRAGSQKPIATRREAHLLRHFIENQAPEVRNTAILLRIFC